MFAIDTVLLLDSAFVAKQQGSSDGDGDAESKYSNRAAESAHRRRCVESCSRADRSIGNAFRVRSGGPFVLLLLLVCWKDLSQQREFSEKWERERAREAREGDSALRLLPAVAAAATVLRWCTRHAKAAARAGRVDGAGGGSSNENNNGSTSLQVSARQEGTGRNERGDLFSLSLPPSLFLARVLPLPLLSRRCPLGGSQKECSCCLLAALVARLDGSLQSPLHAYTCSHRLLVDTASREPSEPA